MKFDRKTLQGLTKNQGDFHLSSGFGVEIDGITVNGVTHIDEIKLKVEVVTYRESEDPRTRTRPGRMAAGSFTVHRDLAGKNKEFPDWRQKVIDGDDGRRSISITFHNDAGEEAKRLNLFHCYPSRYTPPSGDANASGHASESLTINFEEWKLG